MVIFYKRSLKERDNESYAEAIKYRIEKLGIKAEIAGNGIDSVLEKPGEVRGNDGVPEAQVVAYSNDGVPETQAVADCICGVSKSRNMILKDTKDTFTRDFLINQKYIVIILTPALLLDLTALYELDIMHRLFAENRIKVFIIYKDIVQSELPDRLSWVKQTKYTEPNGISDIYTAAVSVAAEYWKDMLGNSEYVTVDGYLRNRNCYDDRFLKVISSIYRELENYDIRAKILVLVIFNEYMVIKRRRLRDYRNHQECVRGMAELVYQGRQLAQSELGIINCCILDMLQKNNGI